MDKKIKIKLPKMQQNEVNLGEVKVKIDNFLTLEKYEIILEDIKSTILYNMDITDKYGLLHIRYIKDVLDLCTNIDISDFGGEELNSPVLRDFLFSNMDNFYDMEGFIEKEYDKWVIENSFGIIANKLPSSEDMEKSMKNLSETIENLPEDKLELISKSIVWNNMPALGSQVAPALHVVEKSE